jgi:hypothetical protein
MSAKYLSCAETAKLLRQALKESFPDVKFGVRCRKGGSIAVEWNDGPNGKQVAAVTDRFEGSYFDGMIDYKGAIYHKLDGEEIRFGADFVFPRRNESAALIDKAIKIASVKYGAPIVSAEEFQRGDAWRLMDGNYVRYVREILGKISDRANLAESPLLKRLQFAGDDGYGAGTVGRDEQGGNLAAKGMAEARERQDALRQQQEEQPGSEILRDIIRSVELLQMPAVGGVH